jgi:hypothetical protein
VDLGCDGQEHVFCTLLHLSVHRMAYVVRLPVLSVRKGLRREKSPGAGEDTRSLRCLQRFEASTIRPCRRTLCRGCAGRGPGGLFSRGAGFTISGDGGANATVKLIGASTATVTANSSGVHSFTGLPNGIYTVTPSKSGHILNSLQSVDNYKLLERHRT